MSFDDIINIREYRSEESLKSFPRMERKERAKIFSPFAALRGYEDATKEEERKSKRSKRTYIAEVERAMINERLSTLTKHDIVKATYFKEENRGIGEEKTIEAEFQALSEDRSSIILISNSEKITIRLKDLLSLEVL